MNNYKPKPYLRRFMKSFKDKVVWITGASSGIGKEAAIQLSKMGAKLILSSRKEKELNDLKSGLSNPASVLVLPLDLTHPETFAEAVAKVYSQFGKVDLLFNNAGISQRSYVVDTDISVDRKLMEINYFGTVALTKAVLPRMLKAGGGHFAVVTSVVGKFGFGVRSAYSASKHALHGFFESLYIELNKQGIEITLIAPGPIQTDISLNALDGSGKPTGEMDDMQKKGMPVDMAVNEMLHAIANKKKEIIIGGFKEKFGVKLKSFWPKLFFKMASKQNPRGELKM
ncbi:SDR family oxidoreductase [Cryomorpha ignava]|nr:SDR family oxidoreductase [Cryomorpha ignava]